jgi:hypothetical protein
VSDGRATRESDEHCPAYPCYQTLALGYFLTRFELKSLDLDISHDEKSFHLINQVLQSTK